MSDNVRKHQIEAMIEIIVKANEFPQTIFIVQNKVIKSSIRKEETLTLYKNGIFQACFDCKGQEFNYK